MIIHNFEQGTEDWHNVRLGKFTASHCQEIANDGKGLETLVKEKAETAAKTRAKARAKIKELTQAKAKQQVQEVLET